MTNWIYNYTDKIIDISYTNILEYSEHKRYNQVRILRIGTKDVHCNPFYNPVSTTQDEETGPSLRL